MVNAIIPTEALRHGVSQTAIGFLFLVFSVSSLSTALFLGKMQAFLGRRNIVMVAFGVKTVTYMGYLLLPHLNSFTLYIIVFAFLNLTQGISAGAYQTSVYSCMTIMFPDRIDYVMS